MNQKFEKRSQLNHKDLAEINTLAGECNRFEALLMKLNWELMQDRPAHAINDFFLYKDNSLAGYLALYDCTATETEVSAMTHPRYRRQGIFRQLLAEARAELKERDVTTMRFICEYKSESGKSCMQAIGGQYESSQYKMTQVSDVRPTLLPELKVRLAEAEDIPHLVLMDQKCFNIDFSTLLAGLKHYKPEPYKRFWIASLDDQIVGKIHVMIGVDEVYLHGLCVLPDYQGRGYGAMILGHTVKQLTDERYKKISLEVACDNSHALRLYQQNGFQTATTYDYYRLDV